LQRPDLSIGDGIYKSIDAGKTWTHLDLRDGQQIPQIAVDPRNPNRLFVAVLGHPYGANEERGIFRSTDGGQTFQKVLYKDENTGGSDVEIDPSNPDHVFAAMWEARQGPWENGSWSGAGGGMFESHDGGKTWKQLPAVPRVFIPRLLLGAALLFTDRMTPAQAGRVPLPTFGQPLESVAAIFRCWLSIQRIPILFIAPAL
jgi:hypothetical protein